MPGLTPCPLACVAIGEATTDAAFIFRRRSDSGLPLLLYGTTDAVAGWSFVTSPMGRRPIPGTTTFPLSCVTRNRSTEVDADDVDDDDVGNAVDLCDEEAMRAIDNDGNCGGPDAGIAVDVDLDLDVGVTYEIGASDAPNTDVCAALDDILVVDGDDTYEDVVDTYAIGSFDAIDTGICGVLDVIDDVDVDADLDDA